jgi:hypothetical protein
MEDSSDSVEASADESTCGPPPTDTGLEGATAAESFRRARGSALWGILATALTAAVATQVKPWVTWATYVAFGLFIGALMGYGGALYLFVVGWWQRSHPPSEPPTLGAA